MEQLARFWRAAAVTSSNQQPCGAQRRGTRGDLDLHSSSSGRAGRVTVHQQKTGGSCTKQQQQHCSEQME
jgi:hypothetical protein